MCGVCECEGGCMCLCVLNLLQTEYQNTNFSIKIRTFLRSEDIWVGPQNFKRHDFKVEFRV